MLVHIRHGPNRWETFQVPTEEDAIRKIKKVYPDAVSGPWEADYDHAIAGSPSTGQIKLVYETESAPGRNAQPIAQIRM